MNLRQLKHCLAKAVLGVCYLAAVQSGLADTLTPKWASAGHAGYVNAVAYSPSGMLIASASNDRTVKIWTAGGKFVRTLTIPYDIAAQTTDIWSVSFSPDGSEVAAGVGLYDGFRQREFGSVVFWRVSDGAKSKTLEGYGVPVRSVAYSPNGRFLATGSANRAVTVWDLALGTKIAERGDHAGDVNSVRFSPDGTWLASGGDDGTIRILRTSDWNLERTLAGHSDGVRSIAFSPDSSTIASASYDKTVKLWRVFDGLNLRTLSQGASAWAVTFSPSGGSIASGGFDGLIKLWDATSGMLLRNLTGHTGWILSLAFSPDGLVLTSGSGYTDYAIKQWSPASGAPMRTVTGYSADIADLVYAPGDQTLVSSSGYEARVLNPVDGSMQRAYTPGERVGGVAVSPDGRLLALPGAARTVKVYRLSDGALVATLAGHTQPVTGVQFSPDGQLLASGAYFDGSNDKMKLWRVSDWSLVRELSGNFIFGPFMSIRFSPNGALVAAVCEGQPAVWRVADGALLKVLPGGRQLRFSPDGQSIAVLGQPGEGL